MTPEQIRHARDLLTRPENTVASIAALLGVSRNTTYKYVPELKQGRAALTPAPEQRAISAAEEVVPSSVELRWRPP
jgi:transposase-like protein